jgi:hypothetical protein
MTGDTHLPEIELELPPRAAAGAAAGPVGTPTGRRKRGFQKAGLLKAGDEETGGKNAESGDAKPTERGS